MKKRLFLIVLLAAVLCFCAAAADEVKAKPLKLKSTVSDSIKQYGDMVYFSFEPSETAMYLLNVTSGKTAAHVTLYENEVTFGYGSLSSGTNECLYELEAGKTYYYEVRYMAYNAKGTIKAKLTKADYRWSLENGVLTISGKIPVPNYRDKAAPWYSQREEITSLVLEEGITSFGESSFRGLENLTEIRIPASLTELSFLNAVYPRLTRIEIAPKNKNYSSEDGVLFDKKKTQLLLYPIGKETDSYTIPDGVTEIDSDAFKGSSLKEVTLPDSLKSIHVGAFENSALVSVNIPKNVIYIPQNPFQGCASLTDITVEEDNPFFASEDGILYSKDLCTLVIYPSGKTDAAFRIPDHVVMIDTEAFADCANLTSVTIPATVIKIETEIFKGCSLKEICFDRPKASWGMNLIQNIDPYGAYTAFGILRFSDSPESNEPPQEPDEELEQLLGLKTPMLPPWLGVDRYDEEDGIYTFKVSRIMDELSVIETNESDSRTVSRNNTNTISIKPQQYPCSVTFRASYDGINPDMVSFSLTLDYSLYIQDDGQIKTAGEENRCFIRYDTGPEFGYITYCYDQQKKINRVYLTVYTRSDGDEEPEETRCHYYLSENGWEKQDW